MTSLTSGATGRRPCRAAVRSLAAAGTGILLTTHYLEEADELADHVVVIDHGRAVAAGEPSELKASAGRDVIEIAVADPASLAAVGDVLRRVTGTEPRLDPVSRRAHVPAVGGSAELGTVINRLAHAAIAVEEIGIRRPTLDEVFMTLTRDPAGEGDPVLAGSHEGSQR